MDHKLEMIQEFTPEFEFSSQNFQAFSIDCLTIIMTKTPVTLLPGEFVHFHYEFFIPFTKIPGFSVGIRTHHLQPEMVFPVNSGQLHAIRGTVEQANFMELQIDRDFMQDVAQSIYHRSDLQFANLPLTYGFTLSDKILRFIQEHQMKAPGYVPVLRAIATELVVTLLRNAVSNLSGSCPISLEDEKPCIRKAIEYFYDHFDKAYSAEDLQTLTNISSYHFIRVFKSHTGKTPHSYFTDIKILKAKEFLKDPRKKVTDVCFMCGFLNHSHFSRVFKNRTGLTPSEFRNRILAGKY